MRNKTVQTILNRVFVGAHCVRPGGSSTNCVADPDGGRTQCAPTQSTGGIITRFLIAACILMLSVLPASAQEYSLQELYKLAKAKDPTVSRAEARLEAGKADKQIAWAGLLPRVSANGSLRQIQHRVLYYGNEPVNGDYTGFSYGAGLASALFNLPSWYQVSAAESGISSADTGLQAARQDLIVRLLDAYLRYLKAQADEKLYRDELNRVGRVLEQAEAFLKAGTGDIIAVYEAKARMDSAAADLVKTEGILRLALQNLASMTGVAIDSVGDIPIDKSAGPQPAELEWWVSTMQQKSPALLQAKEDLLQAEENRKAARAGHLPTLSGNAGYTVDKGSTFLPKVETRQWYAGLQLNVPIYSGGEVSARTRRALAGESERRAMLDDAQTQAIRRLKEAYLNLSYNQSLVEAYQRKHESSALQLKAVQKGRDIGTRTAIDLLNSEQSYAVSRRDLTSALYDNILRQIELKSTAGILGEEDLVAVSGR